MAVKKGVKILIIIIAVILVGAIVAAGLIALDYKKQFESGKNFDVLSYHVRNFEYEDVGDFTAGDFTTDVMFTQVNIDWAYGKVIIESYEGDEYKISEEANGKLSDEEKLQWYIDSTTLYLNYRKDGRAVYKGENYGKTLHFYVPTALMNTSLLIDVWTVSADIEASNLEIGDIDTVTDNGKAVMNNLRTYTCSFTSDSGEIELNMGSLSSIADIITESGTVKLNLPEEQGFSLQYDGVPEKLKSEFKFDPEIKTGGGVYQDDKRIYNVTNTSGKTDVKAVKSASADEQ